MANFSYASEAAVVEVFPQDLGGVLYKSFRYRYSDTWEYASLYRASTLSISKCEIMKINTSIAVSKFGNYYKRLGVILILKLNKKKVKI